MPVFIMKQILPMSEFNGWVTYIRDKPPTIQEHQMAVLTTVLANSNGGKSKHTDFLISKQPKYAKPAQKHTAFDSFAAIATEYKPPTS
jgi:hypothetical protein